MQSVFAKIMETETHKGDFIKIINGILLVLYPRYNLSIFLFRRL